MRSKLYKGFVAHERHKPVNHRFRYPVYVYALDLDELEELDRRLPLFGYNRLRPAAVFDADYLDDRPGTIREKLFRYLAERGLDRKIRSVQLVTSARYFNYIFNPVSFYFCLGEANQIEAMVVEVNNTFGERHVYIPERVSPGSVNGRIRFRTDKAFHVSPFNDMAGRYEFSFAPPGEELDTRIELIKDGALFFDARLWGKGMPLTIKNHARMLLAHPIVPHLTKPRILREAARLHFRKKLPFNKKPEPVSPMTIRPRKKN